MYRKKMGRAALLQEHINEPLLSPSPSLSLSLSIYIYIYIYIVQLEGNSNLVKLSLYAYFAGEYHYTLCLLT